MNWLGDQVHSIREAATNNLHKLADVFGVSWAAVHIVPKVVALGSHKSYLYRMTALNTIKDMARVVGTEITSKQLVPVVVKLSSDPVRSACSILCDGNTLDAVNDDHHSMMHMYALWMCSSCCMLICMLYAHLPCPGCQRPFQRRSHARSDRRASHPGCDRDTRDTHIDTATTRSRSGLQVLRDTVQGTDRGCQSDADMTMTHHTSHTLTPPIHRPQAVVSFAHIDVPIRPQPSLLICYSLPPPPLSLST